MSLMHRSVVSLCFVIAISVAGFAPAVEAPQLVSPGAFERAAVMRDGCTTFSWQEIEGALSYELVAYELVEGTTIETGIDPENVREVLFVRVPGGATSWSPEASDCLPPGGRYAWFVRAVLDEDTGEATEWSAPMLFAVQAAPTAAEVAQALDVLLRYVEEGEGESEDIHRGEIAELARSAGAKAAGRSVQTGTAAIRGEQPDGSGETYGVVGASASPDGAGLGAANTAGGPDLVLDGSAAGAADAELSESGIDRPSALPETFAIDNSGGGGMTVQVDGVDVITTATDQDTVGALSCAADEIPKFVGGIWTCAPDVDTNTDTLAGLLCHDGLVAKRIGGVWVCRVDDDALGGLSCGRNEIAKWNDSGGVWECANDQNTTYSPGAGLLIENGRITLDPIWSSTSVSVLDSADAVGEHNSVAIGADGLGLISYYDSTNGDLKVAHCDDVPCTGATLSILDFVDDVGEYTSVAIGADGLGLISYYDSTNGNLKVAHCDNTECSTATVSTLDVIGDVGTHTSVAIGNDNLGLISYYGVSTHDLKVAHCNDVVCATAGLSVVESDGDVGQYSSIAIGADGLGLISYYDATNGDLNIAHCSNTTCASATLGNWSSSNDVGLFTSVAISGNGLGVISSIDATNSDLRVVHCFDVLCSSIGLGNIVADLGSGPFSTTSMAIDAGGRGVISYRDTQGWGLNIARCHDLACNSADLIVVDGTGTAGANSSIAIGVDGLPLVSYFVDVLDELRVAHLPLGY